jgi:hypothetical protein
MYYLYPYLSLSYCLSPSACLPPFVYCKGHHLTPSLSFYCYRHVWILLLWWRPCWMRALAEWRNLKSGGGCRGWLDHRSPVRGRGLGYAHEEEEIYIWSMERQGGRMTRYTRYTSCLISRTSSTTSVRLGHACGHMCSRCPSRLSSHISCLCIHLSWFMLLCWVFLLILAGFMQTYHCKRYERKVIFGTVQDESVSR